MVVQFNNRNKVKVSLSHLFVSNFTFVSGFFFFFFHSFKMYMSLGKVLH